MPITKSAKKAHRASLRKRTFNDRRRLVMRNVVKKIRKIVAGGDKKSATELLPDAYKAIDKAAKRGVIKKNTAARKKSRLAALINKTS